MFKIISLFLLPLFSVNAYAHTTPGIPHVHPHGSHMDLLTILGTCFVLGTVAYALPKLKKIFDR